MAKILKSKYSSTGERCVDACLNYGMLRYVNEDGSPVNIEIPFDKYEEAISDFQDRIKEGIAQKDMNPKAILKRGTISYNQAKELAIDGKIKGLDFFEIDGSVECEHILGISGSIEYALSIWNGESKIEALEKAVIRSIKVYGEDFIYGITLDEDSDEVEYLKFAKSIFSIENLMDVELYKSKNYSIDNEIEENDLNPKHKIFKSLDLPLGFLGGLLGFMIVQIATNFGENISNEIVYLLLNAITMSIVAFIMIKSINFITKKYVKNSTSSIMELFDEELEKVSYENLLTEKEVKLILKNITKGEVTKLLMDMKGSVNKKVSSNTLVTKETKFVLDSRRVIILPSEYEIIQTLTLLLNEYKSKRSKDYSIKKI
ncbi:hypothetical protein [Romboutsia hominis]|uniref:hypothetical protein n=1 Tax=Romboutsia hominis TaxID=1507512 RepID=UPI000A91CF13|nr:hypothetical protein [Romboutsia hominis]